jgi:DNA helicase II / ATP-dependent DNA helicase PcrA
MTNPSVSYSISDRIYACLDLDSPKKFFLFARTSSGETETLVESLKQFRKKNFHQLRRSGRKVAVITYTRAARDEIECLLEYDSAFKVSTIHGFAWDLIKPYQSDIREWLQRYLQAQLDSLIEKLRAEHPKSKKASACLKQIAFHQARLGTLEHIGQFSYNPNGGNTSRHSLRHSEVINIAAEFLQTREILQDVLVRTYPVLLIDESVNAVLKAQHSFSRP